MILDTDEETWAELRAANELGMAARLVVDWLKGYGLDTDSLMDAAFAELGI